MLLGGSPLRLFRISERAQGLLARWRAGAPVGADGPGRLLARRLVSAGAFVPRPGPPTLGPEDVTVVVPVRDRPAELERLLGSLGDLACVVVDDASADSGGTRAIAERHGARFVGLAVNGGPSVARNAGLDAVDSALVAFVDSDCVPAAGWLAPLLGHFDDPVVAAVAPRIVPSGPRAGATARYTALRSSLDRGPRQGLVRPGSPVPFVPSAALVVRADVAAGPDLFDPELRGGEDVDLVWRLGEAGWDVRFDPASRVEHDGPPDFGTFLARQAFYGSTAGPLALRHGAALAPVHTSAWSLAVWLLTLARRPVLAQAALVTSVAILANRLSGLVRDPVAVAARIAGAARRAAPCPRWRTWCGHGRPRWCSLSAPAGPGGQPPSPCSSPRCATGRMTPRRWTPSAMPRSTSPTTRRTGWGSGPAAHGRARSCPSCRASRGAPVCGRPDPCDAPWPGPLTAEPGRVLARYPRAKRS